MSAKLQQVNYANFRLIVQGKAGGKVRQRGRTTYLYDQHNKRIAMLKAPSVDVFGRTRPVQYFVRSA